MKRLIIATAALSALLVFAGPSWAWRCRSALIQVNRVKEVQRIEKIVVKEEVRIKEQVVVKEQFRVAAIVTPLVQYSAYSYPVYAAPYYVPPPQQQQDDSRLRNLERQQQETSQAVQGLTQAVRQTTELQQQLLLKLSAPKP